MLEIIKLISELMLGNGSAVNESDQKFVNTLDGSDYDEEDLEEEVAYYDDESSEDNSLGLEEGYDNEEDHEDFYSEENLEIISYDTDARVETEIASPSVVGNVNTSKFSEDVEDSSLLGLIFLIGANFVAAWFFYKSQGFVEQILAGLTLFCLFCLLCYVVYLGFKDYVLVSDALPRSRRKK